MSNDDIVKLNTDIQLTDKSGNPIEVNTPDPEVIIEMFTRASASTPLSKKLKEQIRKGD